MSHNLVFFKVANQLAKKESLNTYSLVLKTSEKFDPPYLSDITLFTKSSRQKIHSFGFDLCLFEMIKLCPYSIVSAFQTKLTALKLKFCFCKEYKNKQNISIGKSRRNFVEWSILFSGLSLGIPSSYVFVFVCRAHCANCKIHSISVAVIMGFRF